MHFMRAAWPLIPSEKASIETAPRAKIRCWSGGCFRNALIGMAWEDCGIRIIARKSKTSKRCMGCLRNCCTDYRADAPCPIPLLSFAAAEADRVAADEGDGPVSFEETDKPVDDLAQSCRQPCPYPLPVFRSACMNVCMHSSMVLLKIFPDLFEQQPVPDLVAGGVDL